MQWECMQVQGRSPHVWMRGDGMGLDEERDCRRWKGTACMQMGSTGRADRGDRRSLWRRSEEIVDLVQKSKEGHTAGDARVLSMASEWVSIRAIRAHQSP